MGILEYQNSDGTIRRELRLPLRRYLHPKALVSYKGKPVILTHEAGMIDTENVQQEHIGTIPGGIQDGENVRAQIVIHDAHSLSYGLRELRSGTASIWRKPQGMEGSAP